MLGNGNLANDESAHAESESDDFSMIYLIGRL
jgi:hypothetical protein